MKFFKYYEKRATKQTNLQSDELSACWPQTSISSLQMMKSITNLKGKYEVQCTAPS